MTDPAAALTSTGPRSVDNTVHDLVALANDLRARIDDDLRAGGYTDRRPALAPLLAAVWSEAIPQVDLARILGVSVQAASQAVRLAEQSGCVARTPNPRDRRSKLVAITERGRDFVTAGAMAVEHHTGRYAELVGERRLRTFRRSLLRLQHELGLDDRAQLMHHVAPESDLVSIVLVATWATGELRDAMVRHGHGDLRASHHLLLVHLDGGGARASEVARLQRVSRQAVTALLHDAEAAGYAARRGDPRRIVFALTRRGRRVVDDYVAAIDAVEARWAGVLGEPAWSRFAAAAHDLRHRVRLQHALDPPSGGVVEHLGAPPSRTDAEIADLALDLHAWLGDSDAIRLGTALGRLVLEAQSPGSGSR